MLDKKDPRKRVYGPVPNGPENCCRCRWFITETQYLGSLRAHFNNISYLAQNTANLAVEHEQMVERLENERLFAHQNNLPYIKQKEFLQAERRAEKQKALANEYANNMNATFRLIGRLLAIEEKRKSEDDNQKSVANGTLNDINSRISLIETSSELWQLADICEDAEIYPEEADELLKTPAIVRRADQLNIALMREGYTPVFMKMDDNMKLIAGNAIMRAMAKKVNPDDLRIQGFKTVIGYLEAGHSLKKQGILQEELQALEKQLDSPVMLLRKLLPTPNFKEELTIG